MIASVLVRGLVAQPFVIPSASMLPRLYVGDTVLVAKFAYGVSRYSLPFGVIAIDGRWGGRSPRRGEVVVFRSPADLSEDVVKRIVGLPGDRVALHGGRVVLNGAEVPSFRVADFAPPPGAGYPCAAGSCHVPQLREDLPEGTAHSLIDEGKRPQFDDMAEVTVPPETYFVLGDNRDDSLDSRFPVEAGGVGFVPAENLEGPVVATVFSTDGSARLWHPLTWLAAVRWSRIGWGG